MALEAANEGLDKPHFDRAYLESVRLADGTVVTLRLVQPSDKEILRQGFERLSPRSRYQRFFEAKRRLSARELDYLTQIDGVDHFAIGALRQLPDGSFEGLGIGRFVRSSEARSSAEAAVAVIDEWQAKGIGSLLLMRLAAAARERGIEYFTAEVQRTNQAMQALLARVPGAILAPGSGETLRIRVPLPSATGGQQSPELPRDSDLYQVFRLAQQRKLVLDAPKSLS
jgi:GNAT superfamily N-acetyltransferase